MNHVRIGPTYRVKLGQSTLVGKFDHPYREREIRFIRHTGEDFWEGTIGLFLDTGQIVDLLWDEKSGVLCDSAEEIE